jgi:hypothetical protein
LFCFDLLWGGGVEGGEWFCFCSMLVCLFVVLFVVVIGFLAFLLLLFCGVSVAKALVSC